MTPVTADLLVNGGDLLTNESVASTTLGSRGVSNDGREYRYAKVGDTALVVGYLQQSPVEITNHQGLTPAAAALGANTISITLGATAATANQYAGGFMVIETTPDVGYVYRIASNPAISLSTAGTFTLDDVIRGTAITTTTRVDLYPNPYNGVIINPSTATSAPVGVAVTAITAAYYGWIQTRGQGAVVADANALVVGTNIAASNATAGTCEPHTGVQALVGVALTGIAATKCGLAMLRM
jgi:hypothetical protein